ncbi:uncharacterized protein [Onthophagus taurus]|uniref:uncharacterized protein n=1 Tax=Onthophagus taurus TaxID=166361 RepID=UPI0039BDE6CA
MISERNKRIRLLLQYCFTMRVLGRLFSKNNRFALELIRRCHSVEYISSQLPDIETTSDNVAEYIMRDFSKWTNKTALHCFVTGKKYTFDELRINSHNLSRSLRKILGLKTGDVVAILLPNSPQFAVCTLGTLLSGLRLTTLNPVYTAHEIQRQLVDANVKAIFTINSAVNNVQEALKSAQLKIPIIVVTSTQNESVPKGLIKYEELVNLKSDSTPLEQLDNDDFWFLPYSSGTTGLPKGVMLTNKNLTVNIAQYQAFNFMEKTTENFQDVLPLIIPMFHIYGFTMATATALQNGVKLVTLPKFNPNDFLHLLKENSPTLLKLAPPLLIFLNTYPDAKAEYLQAIRTVLCGAAPLGKSDEDKFREKVGKPVNIVQAYGLTETAPFAMSTPLSKQGKFPGAMGEPTSNTLMKVVKIDDPKNKHIPPNQVGELLIKGPQVMKGYYNKPEETKKSITPDGWFRTGDMVRYDENGMFYIADRIKELIKVKGFQVPPAELEEIIRNFHGVADAAVIGISHEVSGEIPRAYVVPKHGVKLDPNHLRNFVDEKVAPYKRLSGGVAIVNEIPKNPSGKILRRILRANFEKDGI